MDKRKVILSASLIAAAVLAYVCYNCLDSATREKDNDVPSVRTQNYWSLDGYRIADSLWGVFRLYPAEVPAPTPAPEGFEPFYISHYGRHGSRYLGAAGQYECIKEVLDAAAADSMLTEDGKEFRAMFMELWPEMEMRAGELTSLGMDQHKAIAARMVVNYPEIFGDGRGRVIANSTNLERTLVSMTAFTNELVSRCPHLDIHADGSAAEMYYLNPHSPQNPKMTEADQAWRHSGSSWEADMKAYRASHVDAAAISERLFGSASFLESQNEGGQKWLQEVFGFAFSMAGTDWYDKDFLRFFKLSELEGHAASENYFYYLAKGNCTFGNPRCFMVCESLLNDFIAKTEEDLAAGDVAVRLRFGHDGCIMALYCLMGLDGWSAAESDPDRFLSVFKSWEVPMACNIQLVFYRNAEGTVIFRMMSNEEDMTLPFPSYEGTYYLWSDFADFYKPVVARACEYLKETA